jgi:hypothetical protein
MLEIKEEALLRGVLDVEESMGFEWGFIRGLERVWGYLRKLDASQGSWSEFGASIANTKAITTTISTNTPTSFQA